MARWENFKQDAAAFEYPSAAKHNDVSIPSTRGITIKKELDIDAVVKSHLLDNFNRDLGL